MTESKVSQKDTPRQEAREELRKTLKRSKTDILEVAESLKRIKQFIYDCHYEKYITELVPPMLEERAQYLQAIAEELFIEFGVKEATSEEV